jgi:hypothetical protein
MDRKPPSSQKRMKKGNRKGEKGNKQEFGFSGAKRSANFYWGSFRNRVSRQIKTAL